MKQSHRKMLPYFIGIPILLVVAWACRFLHVVFPETDSARTVFSTFLYTLRNVIILSMLLAWCVSLHSRIVHAQVRKLMICVGVLLAFWLFVRHCKFEYTMSYHDTLGRYIWYSYYIPMVMVPLLGVFIVDYIGKPEGYRSPRWMNYLYIPASLFILAVFTNDLHQLVFEFTEGLFWYDTIYSYRVLYFLIMAWFVSLGVYFVIALIRKCRIPGSRKMQSLPLLVLGFAVVFWTQYCLNIFRDLDLTAIDCLIIAALLESAIQSGLIPVNTNYDELFQISTAAMQIVDDSYHVRYASASASALSLKEMQSAGQGAVEVGSTLLRSKPVIGGHALWQDDISQIHMLQNRLKETQQRLKENNDLLRAELDLKRQQAQLDEAHRVYDRVAKEVAPQLAIADALLARLEQEPEKTREILPQICTISAHIKRHGNLVLLGEESTKAPARELVYCVRETLDNLQLGNVFVSLQEQCSGDLEVAAIIDVYDCFCLIVERLLEDMTAILVRLNCLDGKVRMRLQIGCSTEIPEGILDGIQMQFGTLCCQLQEEDLLVELIAEKGGGREC